MTPPGSIAEHDLPTVGFVLWSRPARRAKWEPVAIAPTRVEALALVGVGDRRGGDWLVLVAGHGP